MRNLTFDYSLNGGTSFTGAPVTVPCNVVHAYILPHDESQSSSTRSGDSTAEECQIQITRLHIDILISSKAFNPADGGTLAAFLFMQKWQAAPVRRIYNADVAADAKIDGYDEWDVSTNANYVNIDSANAPDFEDMRRKGARDVRRMTLNCYMRKAFTLT